MSSVTRPRGQLPARVYWVRRALVVVVLAVASGLVVLGTAVLLGTGGGPTGPDGTNQAAGDGSGGGDAAPTPTSTPTASGSPTPSPTTTPSPGAGAGQAAGGDAPVAEVTGPLEPCEPRSVRISSRITEAFAATDIEVPLDVTTLGSEACTWDFSADSVALDITSGDDRVWSSVQCPGRLPEEELVLVPGSSESVSMTWNGQRSDADCSRAADYAFTGWYHVLVAAEGSEPHDRQFELTKAPDEVSTRTPRPKPRPQRRADESAQAEAQTSGGAEGRTGSDGRDGD